MSETTEMKIHGMVNKFWVVTKPSPVSELGDICFPCTFEQFMLQTRGGLKEEEIVGIYVEEDEARGVAMKLVGKAVIRATDAIVCEVMVNIQVMPKQDFSATVLAQAAVEAVGNAIRHAGVQGFRHRLLGAVEMGVGAVDLRNQYTLFG